MNHTARQTGFPFVPTCLRALVPVFCLLFSAFSSIAFAQRTSVIDTPHNLSALTNREIRAVSEQQVCIFCHTPHHADPEYPLWNRHMSTAVYTPYHSNSLQAQPDQPTGSSKLCLSCHDGTIALGNVLSRQQNIPMTQDVLAGRSTSLGIDLSDDHPISFAYDQSLVQKNPKLKSPASLPQGVRLDSSQQLQCSTCHDPHDNQYTNFLVMDNTNSALCTTCHNQGTTSVNSHNKCSACHQSHKAPSKAYLLTSATVTKTCTSSNCHGTQATQPRLNIDSLLNAASKHDNNPEVIHFGQVPDYVGCADCHEPHTIMNTGVASAPQIQPKLGRIGGVNSVGARVLVAQYEYEVCFKCHGDEATTLVTARSRVVNQPSKRLQFWPTAAFSFHPVELRGNNNNVPSLLASSSHLTTSSVIYCSDCHSSDSSVAAGGAGPNGPHGSGCKPLLVAKYLTADNTPESPDAFALCYRCHDRNNILADQSFSKHSLHLGIAVNAPCSACHDSHGIGSPGTLNTNANLINFDKSIVQPYNGVLTYITTGEGAGAGSCTLMCHGHIHDNATYASVTSTGALRTLNKLQNSRRPPKRR